MTRRVPILLLAVAIGALVIGGACKRRSKGGLTLAGSTSIQPYAEKWAEAYRIATGGAELQVQGGGSTTGVKAAISGAAHIGMCSRELKEEEKGQVVPTIIALDGEAIIVHPKNPVAELSLDQLRRIYVKEIRNWKDVGGPDHAIHLVTREEGSGARGAFEELVMKKQRIAASALVQDSQGAVRQMVSSDKHAIGYISAGQVNASVKALSIEGVFPTKETIIAKQYPLVRPFLFLTKGPPTGEAKAFIDWVLGPEGQRIGIEAGIYPAPR